MHFPESSQRTPELLLSPANLMELFVLINFYQIIGIMNAWERFIFSEKKKFRASQNFGRGNA